jgi:hypothetical protein
MQEIDDEEIPDTSENTVASPTEPTYHASPNTPDNKPVKAELKHLSAHALEGTAGPATF